LPDLSVTDDAAQLYDLPRWYDIAFADNTQAEIDLLQGIFADFGIAPPARLIEPAAGTGRLAIPLAEQGYHVTGYDLNDRMLDHGRVQAVDGVVLLRGDMADPPVGGPFDAGFCLIGSLGHLHDDQQIINHLRRTGESLSAGGIYVVQLTCLYEADSVHEQLDWTVEQDGTTVHTLWEVECEDIATGLARQHCVMTVTEPAQPPITHEDRFDLRIWTFEDWQMLIDASGVFDLAAIYDETGERLEWDDQSPVTGEDGNLLYILKRRPQ
jgi:SAM-dependent methyltransferase